jgi:hypothetical protein
MSCEIIQFSTAARIPQAPQADREGCRHQPNVPRRARARARAEATGQRRREIDRHLPKQASPGTRAARFGVRPARSGNTGKRGWKWRARSSALSLIVCPKATTIPRTIRTNAGHCSQTGAKRIAQQLLTPAPDTAAVAWKKLALDGGQRVYRRQNGADRAQSPTMKHSLLPSPREPNC